MLGVLVGVGLTLWLGAKVLEATSPTRPTATTDSTAEPVVEIEPAAGISDGQAVSVTASGLTPGPVRITPCLIVADDPPRCDEARSVDAEVDAAGTLRASSSVAAAITVDGETVDCTAPAEPCRLLVHPPEQHEGPPAPYEITPP